MVTQFSKVLFFWRYNSTSQTYVPACIYHDLYVYMMSQAPAEFPCPPSKIEKVKGKKTQSFRWWSSPTGAFSACPKPTLELLGNLSNDFPMKQVTVVFFEDVQERICWMNMVGNCFHLWNSWWLWRRVVQWTVQWYMTLLIENSLLQSILKQVHTWLRLLIFHKWWKML